MEVIGSLDKDIGKVQKKIIDENNENLRLSKETEGVNNKILALKTKHDKQLQEFNSDISTLK